ncbi:MAG: hypothetical protein AB8B82_11720 [Roseovarius sp.]
MSALIPVMVRFYPSYAQVQGLSNVMQKLPSWGVGYGRDAGFD